MASTFFTPGNSKTVSTVLSLSGTLSYNIANVMANPVLTSSMRSRNRMVWVEFPAQNCKHMNSVLASLYRAVMFRNKRDSFFLKQKL